MIDVVSVGSRFIGEVFRAIRGFRSSPVILEGDAIHAMSMPPNEVLDDLVAQALTMVFDMDANGRIKKEKARQVVEKLGLSPCEENFKLVQDENILLFDDDDNHEDELRVEEIVGGMESDDGELLRRAFTVFDKDGDGFIEASEVKRVLECLGLVNKGWEMEEFNRMVEVVDLNFDGKIDFSEFELMMGEKNKLDGSNYS
ncbi:hypothetical protein Scep_023154 [Stephania cephalantha]|uniref:EF-hand domain-containing protein n=1 Tax=Stephania cephalantha TaxID=152367 RepID=A0AAP0EUN2_9MAGN